MSKFLVYQVGCIECGVSSYPIALCETEEEANRIAEAYPSTWDTEGGDGYIDVIDLFNFEKPKHLTERTK